MEYLRYRLDLKAWIPVKQEERYDLAIDEFLVSKLNNIKMLQRKNWDCMFIVAGEEGSGKSTLAITCGQYLSDMKLTLNNLANSSEEAILKLNLLPEGSVLILDEGELVFSSRDTMTREQKLIINIMQIVRQKRMVLILVCPVFFQLTKYIAVSRSKFLIKTYTNKSYDRGSFGYWGKKKKVRLYIEGKKNDSYLKPRPEKFGHFQDYTAPFDKEYKELKLKALEYAIQQALKHHKRKARENKKLDEEDETYT